MIRFVLYECYLVTIIIISISIIVVVVVVRLLVAVAVYLHENKVLTINEYMNINKTRT